MDLVKGLRNKAKKINNFLTMINFDEFIIENRFTEIPNIEDLDYESVEFIIIKFLLKNSNEGNLFLSWKTLQNQYFKINAQNINENFDILSAKTISILIKLNSTWHLIVMKNLYSIINENFISIHQEIKRFQIIFFSFNEQESNSLKNHFKNILKDFFEFLKFFLNVHEDDIGNIFNTKKHPFQEEYIASVDKFKDLSKKENFDILKNLFNIKANNFDSDIKQSLVKYVYSEYLPNENLYKYRAHSERKIETKKEIINEKRYSLKEKKNLIFENMYKKEAYKKIASIRKAFSLTNAKIEDGNLKNNKKPALQVNPISSRIKKLQMQIKNKETKISDLKANFIQKSSTELGKALENSISIKSVISNLEENKLNDKKIEENVSSVKSQKHTKNLNQKYFRLKNDENYNFRVTKINNSNNRDIINKKIKQEENEIQEDEEDDWNNSTARNSKLFRKKMNIKELLKEKPESEFDNTLQFTNEDYRSLNTQIPLKTCVSNSKKISYEYSNYGNTLIKNNKYESSDKEKSVTCDISYCTEKCLIC